MMQSVKACALRARWAAALLLCVATTCDEGGLNQQERSAGSGDNGVSLDFGEIAIDPTGSYLLASSHGHLVQAQLAAGEPRLLDGLSWPNRVAFAHDQRSLFVTRALDADGRGELVRYDLKAEAVAWRSEVRLGYGDDGQSYGTFPWLIVNGADSHVIVVNESSVDVLDAATGKRLRSTGELSAPVRDVDLTPDQATLVIMQDHTFDEAGAAHAELLLWSVADGARVTIAVPNCADEVTLSRDGKTAFMAPTRCQRDPVSVVDLEHQRFVRNLPGFGPVALAPDGELAVGFVDTTSFDESLAQEGDPTPGGSARFQLMLINPKTLRYELVPLGARLPRYAVAPDGKLLFIDDPSFWEDGRIRVLDVASKQLKPVRGPSLDLDQYVVTRDSAAIYLLDRGLFRVALDKLEASAMPLTFTPKNINITPDDRTLVLRASNRRLWLFDTASGELGRKIDLDLEAEEPAMGSADVSVDIDIDVEFD